MKIKMLTSLAGGQFSLAHGEIVDSASIGGDDVAAGWIAEGLAIAAPSDDVAASLIVGLQKQLDDALAAKAGLEKEMVEAKARIAKAQADARGAAAEMAVHKAARAAAENTVAELMTQIDRARSAVAGRDAQLSENAAMLQRAQQSAGALAAAEADRDEFRRQAEVLAVEIEALKSAPAAGA